MHSKHFLHAFSNLTIAIAFMSSVAHYNLKPCFSAQELQRWAGKHTPAKLKRSMLPSRFADRFRTKKTRCLRVAVIYGNSFETGCGEFTALRMYAFICFAVGNMMIAPCLFCFYYLHTDFAGSAYTGLGMYAFATNVNVAPASFCISWVPEMCARRRQTRSNSF